MSYMVVDRIQQKEKLDTILGAISNVSIAEESFENAVNRFLDSINERKRFLKNQAKKVEGILSGAEEITWFKDVDDEMLSVIKEIIVIMEALSKKMIRTYAETNKIFTKHGIGKTELKYFKDITDDLKEASVDLKEVFFVLPQDKEFQDLCDELNDL